MFPAPILARYQPQNLSWWRSQAQRFPSWLKTSCKADEEPIIYRGITGAYFLTYLNMDTTEIMIRILGPATIILGIGVSATLVIRQMRMQYRLNLRNKALSYTLYANEHVRDARIKIEEAFGSIFLRIDPIPLPDMEQKIVDDDELLPAILTLLAHWENMALAIHSGVCDNKVCFEMVASTLIQHVKIFENFIGERKQRNPRVYFYLRKLRTSWEDAIANMSTSKFSPIISKKENSLK